MTPDSSSTLGTAQRPDVDGAAKAHSAPSTPSATAVGGSATVLDLRRLSVGDGLAALAAGVVFVSLLLPWYSARALPGRVIPAQLLGTASALGPGAGGWRFLALATSLLSLCYLLVRCAIPTPRRLPLPHWQVLGVTASLTAALVVLCLLVRPGSGSLVAPPFSVTLAYGAWVGFAAAVAGVAAALLRRREPEWIDPGGRRPMTHSLANHALLQALRGRRKRPAPETAEPEAPPSSGPPRNGAPWTRRPQPSRRAERSAKRAPGPTSQLIGTTRPRGPVATAIVVPPIDRAALVGSEDTAPVAARQVAGSTVHAAEATNPLAVGRSREAFGSCPECGESLSPSDGICGACGVLLD